MNITLLWSVRSQHIVYFSWVISAALSGLEKAEFSVGCELPELPRQRPAIKWGGEPEAGRLTLLPPNVQNTIQPSPPKKKIVRKNKPVAAQPHWLTSCECESFISALGVAQIKGTVASLNYGVKVVWLNRPDFFGEVPLANYVFLDVSSTVNIN
jgi:hypothetical protein